MKTDLTIVSVRENPEYLEQTILYFQQKWTFVDPKVYDDCIRHTVTAEAPLPQWYLLMKGECVIGCAGLITNDFISRMDLYPWICGVYIEESERGNAYGSLLLEKAGEDAARAGFPYVYLSTDHVGYYEKYGFEYMGDGYHPWNETSRIYKCKVN